jgi:hypothetical protein
MKQVVRIDSAGFYVEPVILEDNDKVPSDCVESVPPSLYKARYVDGANGAKVQVKRKSMRLLARLSHVTELEQLKRNQELMQASVRRLTFGGGFYDGELYGATDYRRSIHV